MTLTPWQLPQFAKASRTQSSTERQRLKDKQQQHRLSGNRNKLRRYRADYRQKPERIASDPGYDEMLLEMADESFYIVGPSRKMLTMRLGIQRCDKALKFPKIEKQHRNSLACQTRIWLITC